MTRQASSPRETVGRIFIAAIFLAASGATLASASHPQYDGGWKTEEDVIEARMSGVTFVAAPHRPDPYIYRYTDECPRLVSDWISIHCDGGFNRPPSSECGEEDLIAPRWAKLRDSNESDKDDYWDGTDRWLLQAHFTCPGDPNYPLTFDDFAALPIAPSPVKIQPDTGWVFAGLDTIAMTESSVQGFSVELRGITFRVGAIPIEFSWDFGDGSSPLVTADPGKPWPDHTVSHRYRTNGVATPTLTTKWKGVLQEGSTGRWIEIPGTGETTTTGPQITIHAPRTRLVEDPVR